MDEVCLMTGEHLVDSMPLQHDEFMWDACLCQYEVKNLYIITRRLSVGTQKLEWLEIPVGSNDQWPFVAVAIAIVGRCRRHQYHHQEKYM
jgi:hypothetical protein